MEIVCVVWKRRYSIVLRIILIITLFHVSLCGKAHADGIIGKFIDVFEKANSSNSPKSSKSKKGKKDATAYKVSSEESRTAAPDAGFDLELKAGTHPLEIHFKAKTVGGVTEGWWDFGDGETSAEQNPTHIYSKPGTYTVKLTVRNKAGESTKEMQVYAHSEEEKCRKVETFLSRLISSEKDSPESIVGQIAELMKIVESERFTWEVIYLFLKISTYNEIKNCPFSSRRYFDTMDRLSANMEAQLKKMKPLAEDSMGDYIRNLESLVYTAKKAIIRYAQLGVGEIINYYIDDGSQNGQIGDNGCCGGTIDKSDLIRICIPRFDLGGKLNVSDIEKNRDMSRYAEQRIEEDRRVKEVKDEAFWARMKEQEKEPEFYISWWDTRAQQEIKKRGAGVFSDKDLFEEAIVIAQGDIERSKRNVKVAKKANHESNEHSIDRLEALTKAYDTLIKTYNQRLEEDKYFDFNKYEVYTH